MKRSAGEAPAEEAQPEAAAPEPESAAPEPEPELKRPAFAARYPRTPAIDALLRAFEAGDFGTVRDRSSAIAAESKDERVRAAALDLRRRIHADATSIYLVALAFALLFFLYLHYLRH